MKEFIIFVCTDSTEIFFSKLRSAGLNYYLPSFFTDPYCAGGVSNSRGTKVAYVQKHTIFAPERYTAGILYTDSLNSA